MLGSSGVVLGCGGVGCRTVLQVRKGRGYELERIRCLLESVVVYVGVLVVGYCRVGRVGAIRCLLESVVGYVGVKWGWFGVWWDRVA